MLKFLTLSHPLQQKSVKIQIFLSLKQNSSSIMEKYITSSPIQ